MGAPNNTSTNLTIMLCRHNNLRAGRGVETLRHEADQRKSQIKTLILFDNHQECCCDLLEMLLHSL